MFISPVAKMSRSSSNSVISPVITTCRAVRQHRLNVGTIFLEPTPALTSGGQGCDSLQKEQWKQRQKDIKQ